MFYKDLCSIIQKPWANVNDIMKLSLCGRDKAIFIRNSIYNDMVQNNIILPSGKQKVVPMKSVLNYLNIDPEYIYFMVEKEKNVS